MREHASVPDDVRDIGPTAVQDYLHLQNLGQEAVLRIAQYIAEMRPRYKRLKDWKCVCFAALDDFCDWIKAKSRRRAEYVVPRVCYRMFSHVSHSQADQRAAFARKTLAVRSFPRRGCAQIRTQGDPAW